MTRRGKVAAIVCVACGALLAVGAGAVLAQALGHAQAEAMAKELWQAADQKRAQGKFAEAVPMYERSLQVLAQSKEGGTTGDKTTLGTAATQMIELCKAMPIDMSKLKDGTYEGTAWGYFSQMTMEVTLKGGKIVKLQVKNPGKESRKQPLDTVPGLIYKRQTPSVDAVSAATCTSYGLMTATERALMKAK